MKHQRLNNWTFLDTSFYRRCGRWALVAILPLVILLVPLVILLTPDLQTSPAKQQNRPNPPEQEDQDNLPVPLRSVDVTLRRGQTLLSVLRRFGLERSAAHAMIETVRPFFNPRKMRAGHSLRLILDRQGGKVQGLEYAVNRGVVRVMPTFEGWSAERIEIPFVRQTRVVRGSVVESLYQSGTEAGLTPLQILDLATIFEYDVDFFSDLRKGDTFSVVLEEIHYADERFEVGQILAAELEANGETFRAIYYAAKDGKGSYYDSNGRAFRRAFLRAPLSYRRISSRYSLRRRHPIFRTRRPHRAIDYAAPARTPVVSIGHGRVKFAGWRHGYGRLVEVRHPNGYVSRYAHFSRMARGIRKGKRVAQGEVIGYVGQSGHATGPHLHFELLHQGRKINFLALRIPRTKGLSREELARFKTLRDERLALLRGDVGEVTQTDP
ncbi:MAG: peptidoglycan DD-metalloendopeptidase family protein [Deltaproteobacteria bacterium]|nr:peptidoglycan DD-metalloendopeptidase family protein [Deltaproteobacteria bacterium]